MSDNNESTANAETGQADDQATDRGAGTSQDTGGGQDKDWQAEAEKWKSMARKHEDRAKENFQKAQEYDKYVESQKTEEQKRQDAAKALQAERDNALVDAALARAALTHGLSAEDIDLIRGGSPEEIDKRAEKLAARLKAREESSRGVSAPDPRLGRENTSKSSGDWLRDQLNK